jgi:GAF domain-containing protein
MSVGSADLTPSGADEWLAKRTASLAEITQAIAASLDVSQIFDKVSELAQYVAPHDTLIILLNQAEPDSHAEGRLAVALCHICSPAPSSIEAGQSWPPASFSFGPTLLANQAAVVDDLAVSAVRYPGDRLLLASGRSALVVPIHALSRVLGGLVLVSQTPECYGSGDVLAAEPLSGLLAVALEHQRLNQQASALAVAEERNRLAREIHDTLAQSLAGIIINLESLKPYDATHRRAEAELLAETETLARSALEEARRSVLNLHPTGTSFAARRAGAGVERACPPRWAGNPVLRERRATAAGTGPGSGPLSGGSGSVSEYLQACGRAMSCSVWRSRRKPSSSQWKTMGSASRLERERPTSAGGSGC